MSLFSPFRTVGAFVVVSAALASAHAADCAAYRLVGVGTGMAYRDVSKLADREGVKRVESGRLGTSTAVPFRIGDRWVTARFSGDDRLGSDARVLTVRVDLPTGSADLAEELEVLRARYGEPDAGLESLSGGLAAGPVVWVRDECGLVISAYRRSGSWWQPDDGGSFVQIESLDLVRAGASTVTEVVEQVLASPREASPTVPEPVAAGGLPVADAPPTEPASTVESERAGAASPVTPDDAGSEDVAEIAFADPVRTRYVAPRYPEFQRRAGVPARVELSVRVKADGTVGDVTVVDAEPLGRGFEEAAIKAVQRWRYRPGIRDGKPAEVDVRVILQFE